MSEKINDPSLGDLHERVLVVSNYIKKYGTSDSELALLLKSLDFAICKYMQKYGEIAL